VEYLTNSPNQIESARKVSAGSATSIRQKFGASSPYLAIASVLVNLFDIYLAAPSYASACTLEAIFPSLD
jgi:hypothetical protein